MSRRMSSIVTIFEDMENNPENYSFVVANIAYMIEHGKIGLSYLSQSDAQVVEHNLVEALTDYKKYHFVINIPYAGKKLSWDVIFNPEDFTEIPDFDFNDDTFLSDPDYEIISENISQWKKWNIKDMHSLKIILNEFLCLYKKCQIEKLLIDNMYSKFKKEYEDLRNSKDISDKNIEIYVDHQINLLIEIPVDCSSLPEYIQNEFYKNGILQNPCEDFAHLSIIMGKIDASNKKIALQLSPRLDQVLGKISIPSLKKDCTLLDYVTTVENILKSRIEFIVNQFNLKKDFILSLVNLFCYSIIEYDTDRFSKVSFIYELNDYQCLVTVKLGPKFPNEKPKVQISSIYCQEDRECNHNLDNFTFSAIDNVEESLDSILKSLKQAVVQFKEHKHSGKP